MASLGFISRDSISSIQSVSIWFENGGLSKLRIDAIFTVFKLISVFALSSIPFWLNFDKNQILVAGNSTEIVSAFNADISSIKTSVSLGGLWGYYFISYLIMSWFISKPLFQKVADVYANKDYFVSKTVPIDTTESLTIDQVLKSLEIDREEFLMEANSMDNFLLALEDLGYFKINLPIFKSILSTRPFEIAITKLLKHYYIDKSLWTFKNAQENAKEFSTLSRSIGFVIIPFLPVLLIFSAINHILTYINNRDFLASHEWNRLAVWKFRYYNEFLVIAKKRLDKTKEAAESVVTDLYLENWRSSIAKAVSFLFSLFSLFLLIFSFNGYTKLLGADIISLMAVFSLISAILFPRKKQQVENRMTILKELKNDITRKEIALYYESKISILLKEILAILYLPVLLIYVIPNHSYFFSTFMATWNKENICTFAAWNNKDKTVKTKASYNHMTNIGQDSVFYDTASTFPRNDSFDTAPQRGVLFTV